MTSSHRFMIPKVMSLSYEIIDLFYEIGLKFNQKAFGYTMIFSTLLLKLTYIIKLLIIIAPKVNRM